MKQRPEEDTPPEASVVGNDARAHDHPHAGAHDHAHADEHDHDHPHPQDHHHDHPHDHDHDHEHGRFGWLLDALPFLHGHSHSSELKVDAALEGSERGIWAMKISLLGLGATALFQVLIVLISGSVALLADTIHNFA